MTDRNKSPERLAVDHATKNAYRTARRLQKPIGWKVARERGVAWVRMHGTEGQAEKFK